MTLVKLYSYFPNSYFKQNFTEAELIKEKWLLVYWAYEIKKGRNQKNE